MRRARTARNRVRDFAIYVAIACARIGWLLYAGSHNFSGKSIGIFGTAFLVGVVVVGESRPANRAQPRFWLVLTALLAVHLILAWPVVRFLEGSSVRVYGAILLVAIVLMQMAIAAAIRPQRASSDSIDSGYTWLYSSL